MTTHEPGGRSPRPETQSTDHLLLMRGTDEILATLPHLLGYRPDHSVVIMATRTRPGSRRGVHRGEMALTLRMDLVGQQDLGRLHQVLGPQLHRAALAGGGRLVLHALCYDLPEDAEGQVRQDYADALLAGLEQVAEACGAVLHDVVHVRDEGRRYRPVVVEARPLSLGWFDTADPADVPAVAELVLQGRSPVGSREDVAAAVRRRDERAAAAVDLALDLLVLDPSRLDADATLAALGAWVVDGAPEPSARDRAWIAVLLSDREVRDAVLARWVPQMFRLEEVLTGGPEEVSAFRRLVPAWPAGGSDAAVDRLLLLAGRTPRPLTAPLVTLAAFTAWAHGEGTVANEACDLALEVEPGYRMAELLRDCLVHGLRPPLAPQTGSRHGHAA